MGNTQRAAQCAAKVIHDDLRLGIGERVAGIHEGIFMIFKDAAMIAVGAGLGDGGDVGDAAEFGVVVGLADANFFDGVEGRKHLVDRAGVLDADAGDAVNGDTKQRGGGAGNIQGSAIVCLYAGLGGERGDGACGAGGTRVDGHGKLNQFVADLGLSQIGDIGSNYGRHIVFNDDSLGFRARLQSCIHAPRLAG